ncbi:hypothetical protein SAMN04488115_104356 [Bosea lathyri]|uniref:Uncharacterized protein n=1 Tax=Bosea lathyri TaxID=1036778 RepID=A0A1H5ZBM0_9HYPH|nr:hypothetical protein SAMN04488115_104356 [Bosea lathyri]
MFVADELPILRIARCMLARITCRPGHFPPKGDRGGNFPRATSADQSIRESAISIDAKIVSISSGEMISGGESTIVSPELRTSTSLS